MQQVEDSDKSEYLKFGQTIFIRPGNSQSSLCVIGDGFISNKAQMFEVNQNKIGAGCVFAQCLFQIYPSFVTSRLDQAQNIQQEFESKLNDHHHRYVEKIQELEERVIMEYKINMELSEKTKNLPVSFAQPVQFLHLASNKFLACNYISADNEQENFKLELNQFSSLNTCFRFAPSFSHQTRNDGFINSDTSLYIMMENIYIGIRPYLHAAVDQEFYDNEKIIQARTMFNFPNQKVLQNRIEKTKNQKPNSNTHDQDNIYEPPANSILVSQNYKRMQDVLSTHYIKKINQPNHHLISVEETAIKIEINVSLEKKSYFHLEIFAEYIQDENLICFGDILWLHHLESNAILVTLRNTFDDIVVNLLSQSTNDSQTDFIGNTNGMWYIEHETLTQGGILEWGQPLRLRHFSLGKYLAIKSVYQSRESNQFNSCFYLSDYPTEDSLLAFLPLPSDLQDKVYFVINIQQTQKTSKYVTKDAFLKLKAMSVNGKSSWIEFIHGNKLNGLKSSPKLQNITDEDSIVMIKLSDESKDDDVLKCYKADLSEIQEQSFLYSCFPMMLKTLNILKILNSIKDYKQLMRTVQALKFPKKINQFQNVIENLNKFCKNQIINFQMGTKNHLQTNQNRQKVLREQYFIEILLEILKYISDEEELTKYQLFCQRHKKTSQQQSMMTQKLPNVQDILHNLPVTFQTKDPVNIQNIIPKNKALKQGFIVQEVLRAFGDQGEIQYYNFINQKVFVIKLIYRLLITICKGNNQNECYVYNKISQFQYQARFIKETTFFIISLLESNEQLLNNLTVGLREKKKDKRIQSTFSSVPGAHQYPSAYSMDDTPVNHQKNKSHEFNLPFQTQIEPHIISPKAIFDDSIVQDNILLYYKKLTEESNRNPTLLEFFRAISKYHKKGIKPNQQIIYQISKDGQSFYKSLFNNIIIENNFLKLQNSKGQMIQIQDSQDQEEKGYLISQLELYSDLALGRNYQWKTKLKQIFPVNFVFEQIFKKDESIEIRSAFCKLAISVYVDNEPNNILVVPNLCRLLPLRDKLTSRKWVPVSQESNVQQSIHGLLDDTFKYMFEYCKSLQEQMISTAKFSEKETYTHHHDTETLIDDKVLTLDIIKLGRTLIQFDMLNLTGQRDQIKIILPSLMQLLEYDQMNIVFPYILHLKREENLRLAVENQNRLVSGFKAVIGEAVAGLTGIGQFVASSFMRNKASDILEEEFSEYQSNFLSKNPIISSLITITQQLQALSQKYQDQKSSQTKAEVQIKLQVCDLLIFFQEQRQDFLISNFISFFNEQGTSLSKGGSNEEDFDTKLNQQLLLNIVTVIPPTLKTGINMIDNKQIGRDDRNIFSAFYQMMSSVGTLLKSKQIFTNYCAQSQFEMHDIDTLVSGQNSQICKAQILPSLLVTLHLTQDQELLDKIILVMRRCFSQKKEFLQNLENVEILFEQNEINCYNLILKNLQQIKIQAESSQVWLKKFKFDIYGQELIQLIQMLQTLNTILLKKTEINNDYDIIQRKTVDNEQDVISTPRQNIFKLLNVHVVLVNFLKESQNHLAQIINDTIYHKSIRQQVFSFMKEVYSCLTNFCAGNETNQELLYQHIDLIFEDIAVDFGQMALACSIFKDNKKICENLPDQLLMRILNFITQYGRQNRFLNVFKVIQTFRTQNLIENQIKVLDLLLPQNQGQLTREQINQREFWLYGMFIHQKELHLAFNKNQDKDSFDQPYSYHSRLFDVLIQTTMGEESFKLNSPRLKNIFKLGYLIDLLMQPDDLIPLTTKDQIEDEDWRGFSILKPKIILTINYIYINNQLTQHQTIIKEQQGFFKVFEKELKRLQFFNKHVGDSLIDNSRYMNYFFDHLIILFTNFSSKMIQQEHNQDYKSLDEYVCLFEMCKVILTYSYSIIKNVLTASQYNNLIKFITSVDEKYFRVNANQLSQCLKFEFKYHSKSILISESQLSGNDIIIKQQKKRPKMTIFTKDQENQYLISQGQGQGQYYQTPRVNLLNMPPDTPVNNLSCSPRQNIDKEVQVLSVSQSSQKLIPINQSWTNQITWSGYLQVLKDSVFFKEEMKSELGTLAQSFLKIDKLIPDQMKMNSGIKIEFKEILKKLVKYVEGGIINKANKDNLIYTLEILEEILNQAEDLKQMQKVFDQNQATKMILNLLSDCKSFPLPDDFLYQLLSFSCKLLEGGNLLVQKTIFTYFVNESKSEQIFAKINSIIINQINQLKQKQKLQIQAYEQVETKDKVLLFSDDDTQFSGSGAQINLDNDQIIEIEQINNMEQKLLVRLLRFLQLFCEGHNIDLQNYILHQFNSRNNYNLVQSLIELLYMYHFDLSKENFDNIQMCLETLTEFVQGPCSANQQQIIDSKFLEIANSLLTMHIPKTNKLKASPSIISHGDDKSQDEKKSVSAPQSPTRQKTNYNNRKVNPTQLERWMLERLKYKSMVLVTSLLELNSDSFAIKRIMRSLPIEILRSNLVQIYRRYYKTYGNQYTQQCLKHIDADPNDSSLPAIYHELILETGFHIYFLINYYSDLDIQQVDGDASSDLQEIRLASQKRKIQNTQNPIKLIIGFIFAIFYGMYSIIDNFFRRKSKRSQMEDSIEKQYQKSIQNVKMFGDTINFFADNSARIELIIRNRLEKIHFIKLPHCQYIPKETKVEFNENVNRDSANAKIQELIEQSNKIIETCKHEEKLGEFFSQYKFLAIFSDYIVLWEDLAFTFTILLNILIILSFSNGPDDESREERFHDRLYSPKLLTYMDVQQTKDLFDYCGYVMIICSTLLVVLFLLKKAPLYIRDSLNQSKSLLSQNHGWFINTILQILTFFHCLYKVLLNFDILYKLTYGFLAFLGTIVHPLFFSFHLTEIIMRYPSLRRIIKSFWEPKISLLLTFVLVILVNYYFTLIAYTYFSDYYVLRCEGLLFCFIETFDKAFKSFGGIGGWIELHAAQDAKAYDYGRFFFDNLYNLIIVLILIKIFAGIIIDTFSSLREQSITKNRDTQEICFICGYDRELFDRKSEAGFIHHIKNEHFMWNYVFYISYIKDKEVTEYSGIESYIAEKLKNQDNSWFPILKALSLKNIDLDSHHQEIDQIKQIESELLKVKKDVSDINKSVEQFLKKSI